MKLGWLSRGFLLSVIFFMVFIFCESAVSNPLDKLTSVLSDNDADSEDADDEGGDDSEDADDEDETKSETVDAKKEIELDFELDFDYLNDVLVVVDCGEASASGFVAEMDGQKYLITNQHVIMGFDKISFTTLSGKKLKPTSVEPSKIRDIVRLKVDADVGLKIAENLDINESIVALGNSQGAGVISPLPGKINGIGPDRIEITSEIVGGNSGGPILNEDMEVCGIATYYVTYKGQSEGEKDTKWEMITRRFALKLDQAEWMKVSWGKYNTVFGKKLREIDNFRNNFYSVIGFWLSSPGTMIESAVYRARDVDQWLEHHNSMAEKIQRFDLKPAVTRNEMERKNISIRNDLEESTDMLSKICADKAREVGLLIRKTQMTEYLESEFIRRREEFKAVSEIIVTYGNIRSSKAWFRFR